MENILIAASKYFFIMCLSVYTLFAFIGLKDKGRRVKTKILTVQKFFLYIMHFAGNGVIYLYTKSDTVLIFYGCQLILFIVIMELFPAVYPGTRRDLLGHICMLLNISFLILTRLSVDRSVKQFKILSVAVILFFIVPWIYRHIKRPEKFLIFYFILGFAALCAVYAVAAVSGGAKLSLTIGPVTLQPSEFVKITYVFMLAACLSRGKDLKHVLFTGILAALHVVVLVLSTDLGAALIFFVTFLFLVYGSTGKKIYLAAGTVGGCAAAVLAWRLFYHIQIRVSAWLDPFADVANKGYQMAQSLFAIGTGKWTGTGLYQGLPTSIPKVYQDFTFSAIAEEFGGIFAICLILLYFCIFVAVMQIALEQREPFHRYVCMGLAVVMEVQTFLTIGGAVKLIPSTGVTLPCVSYGGSSIMSTMLIFAVIEAAHGKEVKEAYEEQQHSIPEDPGGAVRKEEHTNIGAKTQNADSGNVGAADGRGRAQKGKKQNVRKR